LKRASDLKSKFLSGISHELRTPLNSIVSLTRILLQRIDGELTSEQEKQVTFILRSALNLTDLVNDLLDLAKIEAGRLTVKPGEFSVGELFAALRGVFRPLVMNDNVQLTFRDDTDSAALVTDEGKLSQILRNLIANALKFTDNGSVTVTAEPSPDSKEVIFSVIDTGIGIAESDFGLIFEEWGQVDSPRQRKLKGSGLGLPLSKKLAELLGGSIALSSEVGKGSTFTVRIKRKLVEEEPESESLRPPQHAGQVLVIDDDEVFRYVLRRKLESFTNAAITEASSGEDGIRAIKRSDPKLVFVDLMMNGMTGIEVLRRLEDEGLLSERKVFVVTSKRLEDNEINDLKALNVRWFSKSQLNEDSFSLAVEQAALDLGLSDTHH
jgi:CheY-like chemotaxis protein/two-component sensor histidine kinase